ncbi:MAG: glycosyltransferase [Bacteroidales bacterium]|nr:glycosyltransferase [Bacteroidales bacterium]
MPKVSVIIPVYGVERYIEKCVRSLLGQTLADMEFIFVDDCTKDKSILVLERVLEDYPYRKSQVKIIHNEKNLGLPLTRRKGLSVATGDYIAHCDSDDWVDTSLYESMYNKAVSEQSDIVVCDFITLWRGKRTLRKSIHNTDLKKYTCNLLSQIDSLSVCNKLYKRQLYDNDIKFPVFNMGEDMATTLQIIKYCKRVSYVTDVYYYYNGESNSISREETKSATIKRANEACANARLVIDAYKTECSKEVKRAMICLKFNQRRLYMPAINYSDVYMLWKNSFPEINFHVLFNPFVRIQLVDRIKFGMTWLGFFPWIKQHFRQNLV